MSLPAPVFLPQPSPQAGVRRHSWANLLDSPLLLVGYGILAVGLFAATWAHPFTRVIGVGPDPPVFIWYIRWVPFAIGHGVNPLFTSYLDYPGGINLMWQTSVPLLGLLLWPVTATLGPIFAYNLLMTASVALSAWCGFLACRRHVSRPWAAAAGGLLFGFSPYMMAESLGHPHVGVTFLCPLMLMTFEDVVIRQRPPAWRMGLLVGGLAGAQLLISEELLVTQALMAAMALVILSGMRPQWIRPRLGYVITTLAIASGVLAAVAAFPLWIQFFGPQAVYGTLPARNVFVADLAGFVLPTSLQSVVPAGLTDLTNRFGGSLYEAGGYLGLPLALALVAGGVRWWRLPVVQVAAMLVLLAGALSLGLTLHIGGVATGVPAGLLAVGFLPLIKFRAARFGPVMFALVWIGLAIVPILDNVVPSRLMVYVFLLGSLLLAVFADQWAASMNPARPRHAGVAIAALIAMPLIPIFPFPTSPALVPVFFSSGATAIRDGDVALVVPYAHDFESRSMLWQISSGMRFRMPEGYANRPGPSLDPVTTGLGAALIALQDGRPAPPVTATFRATALAELRNWRARAVVVGPMDQERVVAFLTDVIGRPPTQAGGVYLWLLSDER